MTFRQMLKKFTQRVVLAGLVVLVFGLTSAWVAWLYIHHRVSGQVVTVPDLLGYTIEQAREEIESQGLVLKVDLGQRIHSNVIKKDHIYLQTPRPGRKIKTGRQVEVTISAGPEQKRIPRLNGETLNFSKTLLRQVSMEPSVISRVPSNLQPKGRVLSQSPAPDSEIGLRQGSSLLISDGSQPTWFVMPELVGLEFDKVERFMDRHGFRIIAKYKAADEGLGQIVLQQVPRAGYPVNQSQTVTVIVNKDF